MQELFRGNLSYACGCFNKLSFLAAAQQPLVRTGLALPFSFLGT